jgi:hypothetical protein
MNTLDINLGNQAGTPTGLEVQGLLCGNVTLVRCPTAPKTTISVPASLAFGDSSVGHPVTKNLTVRNTGTNPLFISNVTSDDSEFAATGATACPAGGLAHLATCTIAIVFTPNALGAHNATLSVFDNSANSPQHVALTGTGTVDLTTTKSTLVYGDVRFGLKGVAAFAVVNHQMQSVNPNESFSGTNAGDFSITGGTCTTTLDALKSCSIIVSFAPGALGAESATLNVADSPDPLSPYTLALSTGPTIPETVAPVTLPYGTVLQTSSRTLKTTVTNRSPFTISIGSAVSGTNAADFTITGGTCGPTLSGNSSCTIGVTFKPTIAAAESATLAVSVPQDPTSPHNVSLTGTGM